MSVDRHIETFLEMLAAERGAAANTLAAYAADLADFTAFAGTPSGADAATLTAYMAGLTAAGLSARTAARRLSTLRQFHRFLLAEGIRADDPTATLEAPKPGRRLPKYLTKAEVAALLATAAARPDPLAAAALELL